MSIKKVGETIRVVDSNYALLVALLLERFHEGEATFTDDEFQDAFINKESITRTTYPDGTIKFKVTCVCTKCHGTGAIKCPECKGTGYPIKAGRNPNRKLAISSCGKL